MYDREVLPLFITHRKVRRSRCMCFLFLFLIAIFVGLVPIMVYRSLGAPLPDGLRGYRNMYVPSSLSVSVPLSANCSNRNPQSTLDDRPTDEPSQWPTTSRRSRRPNIAARSIAELWNDCETQDYRHTQGCSTVHFGRDARDHRPASHVP